MDILKVFTTQVLCPISPSGPITDCLRGPGCSTWRSVSKQPEEPSQSQRGGDERGGSSLLLGRPGHLAQSSHRLPEDAVNPSLCFSGEKLNNHTLT